MPEKTIIDDLAWFREREGQTIAVSQTIEITKDMIQDFCRSIGNEEWVHWDEARCQEAFGGIIAPLFLAPALFPTLFFQSFDYGDDLGALFSGTDRFRLLSPIKAGDRLSATTRIDHVETRDKGIAVLYDVSFSVAGQSKPVAIGTFVMRYW